MAKNCSFDIISNVDLQEVKNAIAQAMMEIRQRFDFKGSKSEISLDEKAPALNLVSDDDHKMKSVVDTLESKLIKRKVSLKSLSYGNVEAAGGNTVRQTIQLQQGIPQEKGKEIVKAIKGMKIKVQGQVMDDLVRVSGKNRDDLQEVMAELKKKDFKIAMSFTNYR
jgi:uncharacterized protein YajQ (UPF0234 family)